MSKVAERFGAVFHHLDLVLILNQSRVTKYCNDQMSVEVAVKMV